MEGADGYKAMDENQMTQHMMEDLDTDKDGQLSLKEFEGEEINVDAGEESEREEMKKAVQEDFKNADKNSDGKLSAEELQAFNKADNKAV